MSRLNCCTSLAMLMGAITFASNCFAQDVDCLQYPIYEDDSGAMPNYLYLADDYDNNTACDFQTEVYVWSTTAAYYQPCGSCVAVIRPPKGTGAAVATSRDLPFVFPSAPGWQFGLTSKYGKPINTISVSSTGGAAVTFNPSAGLYVQHSRTVKIVIPPGTAPQTTIYVTLYNVTIDYKAAGIADVNAWPNKTQTRRINLGFEIDPLTAPSGVTETYEITPANDRFYYGTVSAKEAGNDTVIYGVATKTPLKGAPPAK